MRTGLALNGLVQGLTAGEGQGPAASGPTAQSQAVDGPAADPHHQHHAHTGNGHNAKTAHSHHAPHTQTADHHPQAGGQAPHATEAEREAGLAATKVHASAETNARFEATEKATPASYAAAVANYKVPEHLGSIPITEKPITTAKHDPEHHAVDPNSAQGRYEATVASLKAHLHDQQDHNGPTTPTASPTAVAAGPSKDASVGRA